MRRRPTEHGLAAPVVVTLTGLLVVLTVLAGVLGRLVVDQRRASSAADLAAGMYTYTGILTALFQRERTGRGAAFEVSLLEALGEWMGFPAYFTGYGGSQPPRTGASHAAIAPYGPFEAGDGKVTVRDRDSLSQDRVAIDDLPQTLAGRLAAPWTSPKLA